MGADVLDVQPVAADHRFQRVVGGIALRDVEFWCRPVTECAAEAAAQQVHQRKNVVGEPCRVGVVLLDPQIRFVIQQAVEARRSSRARRRSRPWCGNSAYWSERCGRQNVRPGLLPYFGLMWPVLSALLPVRKFWPSDDDVVPSPNARRRDVGTAR